MHTTRASEVAGCSQTIFIFDAETGSHFRWFTHRAVTKVDVSQFLPLEIRDNAKGVPTREIETLSHPPPVLAARAAPPPCATQPSN